MKYQIKLFDKKMTDFIDELEKNKGMLDKSFYAEIHNKVIDYLKTTDLKNFNDDDKDNLIKMVMVPADDDDDEVENDKLVEQVEKLKSVNTSMFDKTVQARYSNMSDFSNIKTKRDLKQRVFELILMIIIFLYKSSNPDSQDKFIQHNDRC